MSSDAERSLADAPQSTKKERAQRPAPKIVVDDDSPDLHKFPIPAVFSDGIENSDQIIHAIDGYRKPTIQLKLNVPFIPGMTSRTRH